MVSILTNKDAYPTLSRTFDVAAAFHSVIEVLHDLENILGDGHTRLYNTIRDLVIKKWGRSFVGLSAKTFGLTPRRIGQILGDKGDNEKKLLEVINGKPRQIRTGKEDSQTWVNKLNDVLVKKSGEKSEALRSRWQKMEIYELFVKGWNAECLDRQISHDPSLIDKAIAAKAPTRFQKNLGIVGVQASQ